MGELLNLIFGLCLVLGFVAYVQAYPIYEDRDLYEGSPCTLSNGEGRGVCKKLPDCPTKMRELHRGKYNDADRCGFEEFTEIVCCINIPGKVGNDERRPRPADAACQEYSNEVLPTEGSVNFYVLNGEDAKSSEFPFMAALGYADGSKDNDASSIKYTCGGTLISQQHVLTAAHCVSNLDGRIPVEVRLGTTDLITAERDTQRVPVASAIPHPDYLITENYNDIAILKLREPVRLSNSVQPACLLSKSLNVLERTRNATLVVAGWGVTDFDGTETTKLKKAVGLRFVETNECSDSYSSNNPRLPNGLDNMICAIDPNTTRRADACWGDSGGPLIASSGSARFVAGVTAFGQACGGSTPGVYTSVYDYLSWIEDHVWPDTEGTRSRSDNIW
ncbi:serine protease persephone-like isoform X2 [Neodiprion fabricii]|uniref:serine protease persephone-like isoform X2 n=1 Tax=Neodiprion fabricii TaxID=2872261 RepID=UPI001ED9199C|nr:serine protease persephone-like isoform X2 [Neodiprion fabricii]